MAATSASGASAPSRDRASQPSRAARSLGQSLGDDRDAAGVALGHASAATSARPAARRGRIAVDAGRVADGRRGTPRTGARASSRSASAARRRRGRPRPAPPSNSARSGAWTGSSCSPRSASSSDGTPRPPSRSASRRHWPDAPSRTSRNSQNTWPLVRVEREPQAALPQLAARAQVLEARSAHRGTRRTPPGRRAARGRRPASGGRAAWRRSPPCARRPPTRGSCPPSTRTGRGRRPASASARARSSTRGRARRPPPPSVDEVVQQEVVRLGEPRPPMEQREDLALVALDEPRVGLLVERRPPELHPVLLAEALDLAVAEHRQPGQRRQDRRHAEVLVALAELLDRGLLVGVAHEVDVALEDLRVELEGLLDDLPVARAVLVAEHVHERAVVDAVHARASGRSSPRASRTPRPGGACRAPRPRPGRRPRARTRRASGGRTPPARSRARRATGCRRRRPGSRPPQPLDVLLGEDHRGVEADDREAPRDVEDRPG